MSKTVKRHTAVTNPETKDIVWLNPGDEVPSWAEDLVTNPKVFEDPDAPKADRSMITETRQTTDYGNMNISQLDMLLDERELSKTGNKREKIARLKQSDGATG